MNQNKSFSSSSSSSSSSTWMWKWDNKIKAMKEEIICWAPLSKYIQKWRYEKFVAEQEDYTNSDFFKNLYGIELQGYIFRLIQSLGNLCCSPWLWLKKEEQNWRYEEFDDENYIDADSDELEQCPEGIVWSSGKLTLVCELVKSWKRQGLKFLIFSEFKWPLDLIEF